jgi:hypothetical protein
MIWDVCQAGRVSFLPIVAYTALTLFFSPVLSQNMRYAPYSRAEGRR